MVGKDARDYINDHASKAKDAMLEESITLLSESDIQAFYTSVQSYYEMPCSYILKTWPLTDELLTHADVLDVALRQDKSFASVQYSVELFPCMLPAGSDMDALEIKFCNYTRWIPPFQN